ncbi:unnamed protein product [Allacma fusca]|uniref:Sodium-dependent glucose transporter 1 n=1 Tax=Allacma fusca TaxID=39272 RepID=A0A8J2M7M1_9HEXA|nr:unnamed protein product [Allacma fusca]
MDHRPDSAFSASSRYKKYMASLGVYYSNIVIGICTTFLSPLILDFSHKFNSSVDRVSMVFAIILVCYLLSALLSTIIFRYVNRQIVLIVSLSLTATAFFTIPRTTTVMEFFICSSLIGLGGGGYDAGQVAWIIDIWRDESPPFILTQHFTYSLGTLVPPLLLAPYLANKNETGDRNETGEVVPEKESELFIPFSIAGTLVVLAIVVQLALYIVFKSTKVPVVIDDQEQVIAGTSEESRERENISIPLESAKRKFYLVGLACCIIGFYQGLELCTQQFMPTFSHFSEVKLSETDGARVLFGLQLGYAIGRFAGIILVLKIAPHFIFAGNLVILLVSNTILLVLGGSSVEWLWVGSVTIGVGMSTVYPALYAYIEKYIFVTDSVAGVITIAGGLVSSVYPIIVGNSVQTRPQIMTYVNFASIGVCFFAFAALFWMTHSKNARRYKKLT